MEISLNSIKNGLANFFARYHFIIFFVFSIGGLSIGILMLNNAIISSDDANGYTSTVNNTNFDQDTINRLKALKEPGQETEKLPLTGRTSPF